MDESAIIIEKSCVHNLKAVSCSMPHGRFYCLCGVSGSGKSSFAFDTIFVEGQRRYIESLSHQAKRLFGNMPKPDVASISGLTPTISIEQKSIAHNPRSTVGTLTEIYDYLRVLFARASVAYCPISHEPIQAQTKEEVWKEAFSYADGENIMILAPIVRGKRGTLADTFAEIQRKGFSRIRLDNSIVKIEEVSDLDPHQEHDLDVVVDRLKLQESIYTRARESFTTALELGDGLMILLGDEKEKLFSTHAYSSLSGQSYKPLEPQDFSFNSPGNMCPECHGLGQKQLFLLEKVLDPDKSIQDGCCSVASSYFTVKYKNIYDNLESLFDVTTNIPFKKLSKKAQDIFLYGTEKRWTRMLFIHPETGSTWYDNVQWQGTLHEAYQRYQQATSDRFKRKMEELMQMAPCPTCHGSRLKPYPSAAQLFGKTVRQIISMTISEALSFFSSLHIPHGIKAITDEAVHNITSKLFFLEQVGLGYLTLDRTAPTLSGGEAQRVRLASQIGSGLTGITYVLDEPSIGLHPEDNKQLINALISLKEKGNTLIVVEHDEETIRAADTVIDFGPGAGELGGSILFMGSLKEFEKAPVSSTKEYLFGTKEVSSHRKAPRKHDRTIALKGARHNNLKNISLSLPLGVLVGVTGVSGSGKSSLFLETLYPALAQLLQGSEQKSGAYDTLEGVESLKKVIQIDQSPIGRTPRSNPATYSKVFDDIRQLFALLPESKALGWTPGRFSFNVDEGSCSECSGMGMIRVDMDFLEESWIECPSCEGERFDEATLSVRYKGKSIQDVLEMTCHEALSFFEAIPSIHRKLSTLCDVGLEYLRLGQSSTTLSGGEAQRLKLARELSRPERGHCLYFLDEPTTGLHFHDIQHLMNVLQRLVDHGNSVVVIEHNMDLIKECDWVIDMGPSSGEKGGSIIFEGNVQELLHCITPTGRALKDHVLLLQTKKKRQEPQQNVAQHRSTSTIDHISIVRACQNNLKSLSLSIPRNAITTIIGPSGSGKSSLAFETLYAEGQRRYIESLPPYARQFVKQMPKSKLESIHGISPAVAIEQRQHAGNPRSTVGTVTEIYDYLRILWARMGIPYCPKTKKRIEAISKESLAEHILSYDPSTKIEIFAPITIPKGKGKFTEALARYAQDGYQRIRIKNVLYKLDEIETLPQPDPKKITTCDLIVDRIKPSEEFKKRILSSIQLAAKLGNNTVGFLMNDGEKRILSNLSFSVFGSEEFYPEITAQTFAFNTKHGMCEDCRGLGFQFGLDVTALELPQRATLQDLVEFFISSPSSQNRIYKILELLQMSAFTLLEDLSSDMRHTLFYGSPQELVHHNTALSYQWRGLNQAIELFIHSSSDGKYDDKESELSTLFGHAIASAMKEIPCPSCLGTRLQPLAQNVLLNNELSICAFCDMTVEESLHWMRSYLQTTKTLPKAMERVVDEIIKRLDCMAKIGIGYLSLSRSVTTLSGGEAQRIRLVSQIGSGLTGLLYILDEPTTGLHPQDAKKLIQALHELKSLKNSIVIVEHDPEIMAISDHLIELGPEGGASGGQLMFQGTFSDLLTSSTKTAQALVTTRTFIPEKRQRKKRTSQGKLLIKNASINNLKISSLSLPLGSLVTIAGVSGSGKSTLLFDVLFDGYKAHESPLTSKHPKYLVEGFENVLRVVVLDQKPMSATSRSDLASYSDLMTPLRQLFATLPEAKRLGLLPAHFSAYHRKGMCPNCWGFGYKRISMHFMPYVQVDCPECHGLRLNEVARSVHYKGYNLGQILQLSVQEAAQLFEAHPKIMKILNAFLDLELGYLAIGQEIATLSSGEAQRIKIARELAKSHRTKTLFLMDEPTTGLHLAEVTTLLSVLKRLISEKGHSIIAIEHNTAFIAASDHVIELGPGAGTLGGQVLAEGSPQELRTSKDSIIKGFF